MRSGNIKWS